MDTKSSELSILSPPTDVSDSTASRIHQHNEAMVSRAIESLKLASSLPSYLFLPSSTFSAELEALLLEHLKSGAPEGGVESPEGQIELWSNPNSVFFDCRAGFHRFGTYAYDKTTKISTRLDSSETNGNKNGTGDWVLDIYRIVSGDYRKGLDETPIYLQARSPDWTVHYDQRNPEENRDKTLNLDGWLGEDIVRLAEQHDTNGSWVPYVRNLIGLTVDDVVDGPPSPVTLPLSSLIVLFLKCSNIRTETFPYVGEDGYWRLPGVEGNQGKDEHLFFNATDECMVMVV